MQFWTVKSNSVDLLFLLLASSSIRVERNHSTISSSATPLSPSPPLPSWCPMSGPGVWHPAAWPINHLISFGCEYLPEAVKCRQRYSVASQALESFQAFPVLLFPVRFVVWPCIFRIQPAQITSIRSRKAMAGVATISTLAGHSTFNPPFSRAD